MSASVPHDNPCELPVCHQCHAAYPTITACDVDRQMLRNWRNVAKQLDTVLNTWVRMDTSESIRLLLAAAPSRTVLRHFGTGAKVFSDISASVPKCLGSEVSWGQSVCKAYDVVQCSLVPGLIQSGTGKTTGHTSAGSVMRFGT